jgi:hypothetical protein
MLRKVSSNVLCMHREGITPIATNTTNTMKIHNHIVEQKLNFYTILLTKLLKNRRDYTRASIKRAIADVRFYRSL